MIKAKFLKKEIDMFDNVIHACEITSKLHTYIVSITFCGGIDEDGNENLFNCINAEIAVQETKRSDGIADSNIVKLAWEGMDIDAEVTYEKENGMEYMSFVNEDSFISSQHDYHRTIERLIGTLVEVDGAIDPTPNY